MRVQDTRKSWAPLRSEQEVHPESHRIDWDWPIATSPHFHAERTTFLRAVFYEISVQVDRELFDIRYFVLRQGTALSINLSSGGMLLLMDHAPKLRQVMTVHLPRPSGLADGPILAEVRWRRRVPLPRQNSLTFVGLKFLTRHPA